MLGLDLVRPAVPQYFGEAREELDIVPKLTNRRVELLRSSA